MSAPQDDDETRSPVPEAAGQPASEEDREASSQGPEAEERLSQPGGEGAVPPGAAAGTSAQSAGSAGSAGTADSAESAGSAASPEPAGRVEDDQAEDGGEGDSGEGTDGASAAPSLPPSIPPRRRPAPVIAPERRRSRGILVRLGVVVAVVLVVGLLKTFVLQTFKIPSASMEGTLHVGDQVAVTMYDSDQVRRGDVIVFTDPDGWLDVTEPTGPRKLFQDLLVMVRLLPEDTGYLLIKRVIGVGGDHVVSDGRGTVSVNGTVLDETYLEQGESGSLTAFDVTVPEGHVWVMGDNRSNSADSRYHQDDVHGGAVPADSVVGVARWVVWPLDRWNALDEGREVFADVPDGAVGPGEPTGAPGDDGS